MQVVQGSVRSWKLLLTLAALGCGDGDDKEAAADECVALVEGYCDRMAECTVDEQGLDSSEQEKISKTCRDDSLKSFNCDNAKAVTDLYDTCIDDIPYVACGAVLADDDESLPASCRGVILF